MRLYVETSTEAIAGSQRQAEQIETERRLLVIRRSAAEIRPVVLVFEDAIAIEAAPPILSIGAGNGRIGAGLGSRVGEILLMLTHAAESTENDPAPAGVD